VAGDVAQIFNLLFRRIEIGRASFEPRGSAGYKPARRQISNLRYDQPE
jgi:hypothetical protein